MIAHNHKLLENLGVSCPKIEQIITILKGKYHAKLTGAGLGGFVIGFKMT
jgi:mevalonate kinase